MGRLRARHLLTLAVVATIVVLVGCLFFFVVSDPGIPILFSENGAVWIKPATRVHLEPFSSPQQELFFRAFFETKKPFPHARLTVRALRDSEISVDGRVLRRYQGNPQNWKQARSVDLPSPISPGRHEIRIEVLNRRGPAVVLAYSEELGIRTGPGWSTSVDGKNWGAVRPINEKERAPLAERFGTTFQAFAALGPFQILLFASVFLLSLRLGAGSLSGGFRKRLTPSVLRWVVIGAWVILAANNITRIPLIQGFDVAPHYDYISFIAETGHVPLASDGWQMFQSPFYYFLSAILLNLLSHVFNPNAVVIGLRIIPLLCGIFQVEICYRALRQVYPRRPDLQALGTLVGGLMPMNLYVSQYVGNEPLAGLLTSLTLLVCFQLLTTDRAAAPHRYAAILGILLGFAILTKVTALLLTPLLAGFLIYLGRKHGWRLAQTGVAILIFIGCISVITGWYHIRNWIELGKPFIGGWDPARGIAWWQEPGYRIPAHFATFGESLIYPVFAGFSGFWDAIYSSLWGDGFLSSKIVYEYRPPWNYRFMFSGILFSLLPALAIAVGLLRTLGQPRHSVRDGRLLAAVSLVVYFSALIYLYATLPIYSTAKATYTLGLLPCYAILSVEGLDWMMRGRLSGALMKTLMVCWAVNAYLAFFVV
ncbi:MAG: hypothetical protein EHM23_11835 [Acidobacteria bacterium]|nr:MAG: hypothetical protein EHM23_11835 [Acidobacteriota bacterium]